MEKTHGNQNDEKFIRLTTQPVGGLICRLAVPCMISMLITAFYNLADTFFVGMLKSNSATGAVGIAFSLMAIIQAVGFFFGHGSGNYISRELGRHDSAQAAEMASTGFFLSLACGALLTVLGLLFLTPLVRLLGATETIVPYARSYVRIILLGAPWMTASLTINNQLRFQGSAFYGMVGICSGAVLNIGLDPLLIFVFDMGIAGAAVATIISQFAAFCLLLIGCTRGGNLRIRFSNVRICKKYLSAIVQGGLPSLGRQMLNAAGGMVLNHAARLCGADAAIAAMSVVNRIMMTANSALIGFGQGFQPVCGFNYGAGLWDRVSRGFWFCVKTSAGFLLAFSVCGYLFAPQFVALFRDDPEVIAYGTTAMRLQCITFSFGGWVMMSNMMMQTIGHTAPATFLAVTRQGLFLTLMLLLLTPCLGMLGVQLSQPLADLLTLLCAIPLQCKELRLLKEGPGSTAS